MTLVTVCPCCGGSGAQRVASFRSRAGDNEVEYRDVAVGCPNCMGTGVVVAPAIDRLVATSDLN